jgi:hypothetical protein
MKPWLVRRGAAASGLDLPPAFDRQATQRGSARADLRAGHRPLRGDDRHRSCRRGPRRTDRPSRIPFLQPPPTVTEADPAAFAALSMLGGPGLGAKRKGALEASSRIPAFERLLRVWIFSLTAGAHLHHAALCGISAPSRWLCRATRNRDTTRLRTLKRGCDCDRDFPAL